MKKTLLFLASVLMSVAAFAQWTCPEPEKMDIAYGDTVYLYNVEAKAFFRGANSWGTRASVDASHGYKCVLLEEEGYVAIKDSVEDKGAMYYLRAKNYDDIYVDCAENDMGLRFWSFTPQGDGSYTIASMSSGLTDYILGVDLTTDNHTVLWLLDPKEISADEIQVKWWIVSMNAYNAYMEKHEVYAAAMALSDKIAETQTYGIATDEAEKVYNNTSSTKDELVAAANALQQLINEYKEGAATPDNPQDLTSTFIPDGDFELNQGSGVWQRTHSAQNYQTSGTPGKMGDSTTFLEAWHPSSFTGKMYVPITGLPNGVYQFFLSVATNGGDGCYVYAGNDSVEVTTGDNMTPYTVFTRVEDGNLEVGLNLPKAKQNWIGIDDAKLLYLGNSVPSYAYWAKINMQNAPHYDDDAFIQAEALAAYNEILNTDPSSFASVEEILAFNEKFNEAAEALKANAAAYAKFSELCGEAEDLQTAGYAGDEADELYDYLSEVAEEIRYNRALTTEEMIAECEKLSNLMEVVKTNCLAAGMDCTNLIVNPNFNKRSEGWSYDTNLADVAYGGLGSNPNVEKWNDNFDFYQVIANVPNGVYELKVQAFYRPTGDTKVSYDNYIADPNTDEILAFIYANGSEKAVKNIGSETYTENFEDNCTAVADGIYCPNGMNSASRAFSLGGYENVVYGVVTDGTLKVGIKSTNGSIAGRWTLWDNFRLTYVGKDESVLMEVLPSLVEQLAQFEEENAGSLTEPVMTAIDAAIAKGNEAADGDEMFDALVLVEKTLAAAKANKEAVDAFVVEADALAAICETYPSADQSAYNEIEGQISNYTSLTTDEVLDLIEKMKAAEKSIIFGAATEDEPADITDLYIVNPRMDTGNISGWTDTFTAGNHGYQNNQVYGDVINQFMEAWISSSSSSVKTLADGSISQEITLPAGSYVLSADVIAKDQANNQEVTGMYLFAGENRTAVNADAETPGRFEVAFVLTEESTIAIGVMVEGTNGNWLAADNFNLICKGADTTSINAVAGNLNAKANSIYTISGTRIANVQKGLNIVKMSNGSVKKIFVK